MILSPLKYNTNSFPCVSGMYLDPFYQDVLVLQEAASNLMLQLPGEGKLPLR